MTLPVESFKLRVSIYVLIAVFSAHADAGQISVADDLGRQVSVETPVARIVSLAPHLTEILFELGLGERIVGVAKYSDYPPAAREILTVGDAFSINLELIVSLKPDLVVAWWSGGSRKPLARLESLGIPVFYSEPLEIERIADNARKLAILAGIGERGSERGYEFHTRLEKIRADYRSDKPVRVFYQISDRDLYTINRTHLIGQAISLCGGLNIFEHIDVKVPLVSREAVVLGRPDLIIHGVFENGDDKSWKRRWQKMDMLPAAQNSRLIGISADKISRPSFRMLDGIQELCEAIDLAGRGS